MQPETYIDWAEIIWAALAFALALISMILIRWLNKGAKRKKENDKTEK
jgi:uncharacterized membrane protein YedE/YeeE